MKTSNRTAPRPLAWASIIAVSLSLGACARDMNDLNTYVQQVKSRPGQPLKPIDPIDLAPVAPPVSQARDPFESFLSDDIDTARVWTDPPNPPWPPHNPEELERFELDALRLVGTVEQSEEVWGLVRAPDGIIHRVKVGNYIGKNHGKITLVAENRIELLEKFSNGQGSWDEREAAMALVR